MAETTYRELTAEMQANIVRGRLLVVEEEMYNREVAALEAEALAAGDEAKFAQLAGPHFAELEALSRRADRLHELLLSLGGPIRKDGHQRVAPGEDADDEDAGPEGKVA